MYLEISKTSLHLKSQNHFRVTRHTTFLLALMIAGCGISATCEAKRHSPPEVYVVESPTQATAASLVIADRSSIVSSYSKWNDETAVLVAVNAEAPAPADVTCITNTATVELKAKTTVGASTDGYSCSRVAGKTPFIHVLIAGCSGHRLVHVDPGLAA